MLHLFIYGFALAFSAVIASLETLRLKSSGFTFEVSWRTLVVFVAGAALLVPLLKVAFDPARKRWRWLALFPLVLIGVAGFLYPLHFIPQEKVREIAVGLVCAVAALSTVGGILLLLHRALEADAKRAGDPPAVDEGDSPAEKRVPNTRF